MTVDDVVFSFQGNRNPFVDHPEWVACLFENDCTGNPPPNDCSGTFSFDFNQQIQSGVDPFLVAGGQANAQYWSRDPLIPDGSGASLSDAVGFEICP